MRHVTERQRYEETKKQRDRETERDRRRETVRHVTERQRDRERQTERRETVRHVTERQRGLQPMKFNGDTLVALLIGKAAASNETEIRTKFISTFFKPINKINYLINSSNNKINKTN